MILERILATKAEEVASARKRVPEAEMAAAARAAPPPRDFAAALRRATREPRNGPAPAGEAAGERPGSGGLPVAVIAEVKKASPSRGVLRADFDPVAIARGYMSAGAAAISVLTDGPYFQGSLDHLRAVRAAVPLPLLRKDFIIDPYQIDEARAAGADAILLIVAARPDAGWLAEMRARAAELGMASLVEVHTAEELRLALAAGADLVGINNRDLRTFVTDLSVTLALAPEVPPEVTLVSESGLRGPEDCRRVAEAGVHAVLVGEHLVRQPDPGEALRRWIGEG